MCKPSAGCRVQKLNVADVNGRRPRTCKPTGRYVGPTAKLILPTIQDCLSTRLSSGPPVEGGPLWFIRLVFPLSPLPPDPTAKEPGGTSACPIEAVAFDAVSPGTTPASDRRAISARTAPSHLISSSSLGAHNRRVRLVVMILNVWAPCPSSPSSGRPADVDGDAGPRGPGLCRCVGRSYSSASNISENGKCRWGLVSI